MKAKVTIGVCVRNCEKKIEGIMKRILNQDFPHDDMEVIFVDDGSEDGTFSSILKHAPRMNINYKIYHHEWRGLGFSRNVVAKNAQGNYIVWVDDGTIIPRDYVRKQVRFMEKHLNVGIVRGRIETYSGSSLIATLESLPGLVFSQKYMGNPTTKQPGISGCVFRVKAMKQVGGFDENIRGAGEDTDIAYRVQATGWAVYITPPVFSLQYDEKFKKVWDKNFWYGYGLHSVLHKHRELIDISYKSTPLTGFFEGLKYSIAAYKLTGKKVSFLLPIYFFAKRLAWFVGFIRSHIDSYGHI